MGIFQQKKADAKPDEFINIERLETDLAEFYNVTDQMRENTLDVFEVFNKLEPSIKSSKENRDNKECYILLCEGKEIIIDKSAKKIPGKELFVKIYFDYSILKN